jgi:signal transduction histidine kinase
MGEPRRLPESLAETLLRVANEGLNNALRHGGASRIRIRLKHTPSAVELRIHDNGRWRKPVRAGSGLGLRCLRESLAPLGGTLSVIFKPSGRRGTTLTATLPAPPAETLP